MVYNPEFHDRTKHIEVKHHFIRGQAQVGNLQIIPVSSCDPLADILTKPLASPAFKLARSRIGFLGKPVTLAAYSLRGSRHLHPGKRHL
jgi:hypothetical protein